MDLLTLIETRRSTRVPFDSRRSIERNDLMSILEAARWSPTPHNMQNFEIMAIDDKSLLKKKGNIKYRVSLRFLEENYQQLSFSEDQLVEKRTGLLATWFPKEWTDPGKLEEVSRKARPFHVSETLDGSPLLLLVMFDSRKRAPDSPGDFLGIISLGCVMENMWLMAHSLGIAFHIMSEFGEDPVENESKRILKIPEYMKIAYGYRLGYPVSEISKRHRVRREAADFTHHNMFGKRGVS